MLTARLLIIATVVSLPLTAQQRDSALATRRDSMWTYRLAPVRVRGRADDLTRVARSASQGRVGMADLRARPLAREGELLEAVPGMILTQHSGDGKANQMFVRGFNLDHGTDFATSVDGMPLNMPSHGHGQGYTDLNLLIPEFVDHLEYTLGNYYAEVGDFGSAGAARISLRQALRAPLARIETGDFGFRRAVAGASATRGRTTVLVGGEMKGYDGPWLRAQALGKRSGLARATWRGSRDELSVLGMHYTNAWRASDQIPLRLVNAGVLSPFGQVDSTLGGQTSRSSVSAAWRRSLRRGVVTVNAFGVRQDFGLTSNFTYAADDSLRGDQFRQLDRRTIVGGAAEWQHTGEVGPIATTWRLGTQLRRDGISNGLLRSAAAVVHDTVRVDDITQQSVGVYGSVESQWTPWLRTVMGVRGDRYDVQVRSSDTRNSGRRAQALAQPKVTVAITPTEQVEAYLSGGVGFHSNDARGAVISIDPASGDPAQPVDPLVRSRGAEVGVRLSPTPAWRSTIAAWTLSLDSELLFVGDAGTTEPQGGSTRRGLTIANYLRPHATLTLDADVSLARARYRDQPATANRIPGALENVVSLGVTWEPTRGPFVSARVRHFGAMPLTEDNSVRGQASTLANLSAGWRVRDARVTVSVLNVLNTRARDIQYFYASRLRGEAAAVSDVHFHPSEPRQVRAGVSYGW